MGMALVVHGGADAIEANRMGGAQAGCREALLVGWRLLQGGASALDAVEAAVRALEDNPNFNAGTGSCLTLDGHIEMDAGMMEGHTLRVGAVACIDRIKNPIVLARHVLESPHSLLLVGAGAHRFAQEQGMSFCRNEDLLTERQYANWQKARAETWADHHQHAQRGDEQQIHRIELGSIPAREDTKPKTDEPDKDKEHGTVGAVALDSFGRLAAATSTGGIMNKYPGRVGDSPLVGCGFYADEHAAVSCTGYGEDFARLLMARRASELVAHGRSAREAAEEAIAYLSAKVSGKGGMIVVDHHGNVGYAWNSSHMAYAAMTEGMIEPLAGV
jgi:beta-aspartyl-peptidase (threonine type)